MDCRFFLVPFLPALAFDEEPELTLHEVLFFLKLNLSSKELFSVRFLLSTIDLDNVRLFYLGKPMTAAGQIPHEVLREQLENDECDIPGVPLFCEKYTTPEERSLHTHELTRCFLENIPADAPPFIRNHFRTEQISRHLMAYLRSTKNSLPYSFPQEEIPFDVDDPNTWPEPFKELGSIWSSRHIQPNDLETALSKWRFETISLSVAEAPPFSLDHIFAYMLKLHILESRREMKNPIHTKMLERIVEAVS